MSETLTPEQFEQLLHDYGFADYPKGNRSVDGLRIRGYVAALESQLREREAATAPPALNAEGLRECPVPWCKPSNTRGVYSLGFTLNNMYRVGCTCLVTTPWMKTREEAISRWNTRPTMAAPAHLDNVRMKAVKDNCWDVTCVSTSLMGEDDADVIWHVIEHHMQPPCERCIGSGSTPEEAIDKAMAAASIGKTPQGENDERNTH